MLRLRNITSYSILIIFIISLLGIVFSLEIIKYLYYTYLFFLITLIFLLIFTRKINFKIETHTFNYIISLLTLIFVSLTTTFISKEPNATISRIIINFLPLLTLALIFQQSKTEYTIKLVINFIIKVSFFNFIFILILHTFGTTTYVNELGYINKLGPFYQIQFGEAPFYRYSGIFNNPNALGIFILFSITAYEFAIYKYNKKRQYSFYFISLIILFFSFSRTAVLSIFIFYYLLFFIKIKNNNKIIFILTNITILTLTIYLLPNSDIFNNLLSNDNSRLTLSLNSRDIAWGFLIDSIVENPILGVGFGVSNESILDKSGVEFSAHNLHFQMLSEIGIIGYLLFLIAYFYPVLIALKNKAKKKSDLILINFLIALIIHQFFENTLFRGGFFHLTWFFFSIILLYNTNDTKITLLNKSTELQKNPI